MDDIFADADFLAVVDLIEAHEIARRLIANVVKIFKVRPPYRDGISRYTVNWARTHPTSPADIEWVAAELAPRLTDLYWRFTPRRLRGALVERLVYSQIAPRYEHNTLEENATITVTNGGSYTSSTSVDVAGWDGGRGECHDCKARSFRLDIVFLRELETNLPAIHFKIGAVTLDSRAAMTQELVSLGYTPAAHTTLIPLEDLWSLAPLQA